MSPTQKTSGVSLGTPWNFKKEPFGRGEDAYTVVVPMEIGHAYEAPKSQRVPFRIEPQGRGWSLKYESGNMYFEIDPGKVFRSPESAAQYIETLGSANTGHMIMAQLEDTVAIKYMMKQAAGTEADIQKYLPLFVTQVGRLKIGISERLTGTFSVRYYLEDLLVYGRKVVDAVLSTRAIPPKDVKTLELTYRLFAKPRLPQNTLNWWDKNEKFVLFLIHAAQTWLGKQDGTDEMFQVGPFKVINTIGATGEELESLRKGVERVGKLLQTNPIPGIAKTLYGDIHVVGKITKAHHAAWYYPAEDSMYVRRTKHTGLDEIHAMIHELGHRYWKKFASETAKKAWSLHHYALQGKDVVVKLPEVGDEIPVKIPRLKGYPMVEEVLPGQIVYGWTDATGKHTQGRLPTFKIYQFYRQEAKRGNFPTAYSATDYEEHFCDTLALYVLGTLPVEFAIPFKEIWG